MTDEVSYEHPAIGKMKIAGQYAVLMLCVLAAGAALFGVYLHFEHEAKAATRENTLVRAFEKVAEAQENQARATRETACIVAYRPQIANPTELLELCRQITR